MTPDHVSVQAVAPLATLSPVEEPRTGGDRVLDRHDAATTAGGRMARHGAKWLGGGNLAGQITRVATTVALARILTPRVFGLVALVTVVTGFFERVLGDTGTSVAIVRHPQVTQRLASSVFWFNLCMGSLTTVTFALAAGPIAVVLGEPSAAGLVRGLGCMALINAVSYVPRSLLRRQGKFRALAVANYVSVVVTGVVSIAFAMAGWGAWALVLGYLLGSVAFDVAAWIGSRWRPSLCFSRRELMAISGFSFKLSVNNFFGYFTDSGDRFIVGRFLGSAALGYYGLALRLLNYPLQISIQTYQDVMLPTLARLQNDHAALRRIYLRSVGGIAFVLLPLTTSVAVLAEPMVLTVLGERWRPAIPLVAIIALVSALQATTTTTGSIYLAVGRSDLLLRWAVASSLATMTAYIIGTHWQVEGVAVAFLVSIALLTYPCFRLAFRLVGLTVRELLAVLFPTIVASAVAGAAMLAARVAVSRAGYGPAPQLLAGAVAGSVVYATQAVALRPRAFRDLLSMARRKARPGTEAAEVVAT